MLVSSRDFLIGNACNIIILNYGAKNFPPLKTMNEDQIKATIVYGPHVLPILFEVKIAETLH